MHHTSHIRVLLVPKDGFAAALNELVKWAVTIVDKCFIPAPRGEGPGEFIGRLVLVAVLVIHHSRVRMPPAPPMQCCGRQCIKSITS